MQKNQIVNPRQIAIIILLLSTSSCKKYNTNKTINEDTNTFNKIFIEFWHSMNIQYVYWDKETTDWDLVYKRYGPLFKNLSNSEQDKRRAVSYFKELTAQLIDNHFQITFREEFLAGSVINPAMDKKASAENFHERFDYNNVIESYLDKGYVSGKANINQNGIPLKALTGTINNVVLYFHCNFFALKQAYELNNENKVREALSYFFSQLKRTANPIKGIILDLRNNMGGNIEDLNFLAGKLVNKDIVFGYTRSKNGLGKWGYLPWLESRLKHDPDYQTTASIMLLGDNFTASLSEIYIIALRSKTNLFIGEQTYGATGPVSDPSIFNSGSFSVSNFLDVQTSAVEFKTSDGSSYENVGITPDIYYPFNLKDLSSGKDKQLELAIAQIEKH